MVLQERKDMKRSESTFPLKEDFILLNFINDIWKDGWLDEYSDKHFLIRAIENRLTDFLGEQQLCLDNTSIYPFVDKNNFVLNFLLNFSAKMSGLCTIFGKDQMKKFVTNQLSAGKDNYNEEQFFRALSEISVISYLCSITSWKDKIYEPQINGKKNPEVRLVSQDDVIIDVEVKTPGFKQTNLNKRKIMPTVLLSQEGRLTIEEHCKVRNIECLMPRVGKLKDFINSAAEKFEIPKNDNHLNLLFINWSYSEFAPDAYLEAYSLLVNPINGIIRNKNMGVKIGISEDAYDKISAIIVYSDSLNGLTYLDLRYLWIKQKFRMIALNQNINYRNLIGMNADPDPEQILCVLGDEYAERKQDSPTMQALPIISQHILRE